jgi:hypothetical protein
MTRLRDKIRSLRARWKAARQPGEVLRDLDADDREALAFLASQAGEVLRDGRLSKVEWELLREAWEGWKEARENTE